MSSPDPSRPLLRLTRWLLFALGLLVMLTTMFYTAENWRGRRAWERCRRQLEAQGEVLDWSAYLPAPVPDDQNVFQAPWMDEWFVKNPHAPKPVASLTPPLGTAHNSPPALALAPGPILLAEIQLLSVPAPHPGSSLSAPAPSQLTSSSSPSTPAEPARGAQASAAPTLHAPTPPRSPSPSLLLRLDDPATPAAFLRLVLTNYAFGPASCTLVARPPDDLPPVRVFFPLPLGEGRGEGNSSSPTPSLPPNAPAPLHPPSSILRPPPPASSASTINHQPSTLSAFSLQPSAFLLAAPAAANLRLCPVSSNSFRLWLDPGSRTCLAADYLDWSDQYNPTFTNMRQALARPLARMNGDYQLPAEIPIIHFVHMREVAQTLAQRAQCHLLLGQPDAALQDLTLLHDLSRLLDTPPAVLVSAMIHVALTSTYAGVVADGLRLQAWREPQLAVLQQQLGQARLLTAFRRSLQTENAARSRTLELASATRLADLYQYGHADVSFLDRFRAGAAPLALAPRGWLFQNRANLALAESEVCAQLDPVRQLIRPHALEAAHRRLTARSTRFSPYTYLQALALPNYLKAAQGAARAQVQADLAFLACALERYRLAHGAYPGTLDALIPQFAPSLPSDPITGRPFHYRPTPAGFLVYSVGWNETDDQGLRRSAPTEGDWVW